MQSLKKLFSFRGLFALVLVAITIHFVLPELVFAQSIGAEKGVLGSLAELLGVLISVLTFISLLMMKFFGQLLGTNLLTGPEAMQALTPMWVWVRNLTNILFVIVLVGLAFSNLFASFSGENGGNWTIKEKLPKVIIALVAINFSLLGFKVVIDAVNVGTVAILGIADSRLDADNPEQQDAMINDKTWTMVSDTVYDGLVIEEFTDPTEKKDKVKAGKSCTAVYNKAFEGGNPDNKVLGLKKEDGKNYICRDFRSQVNDLFCSGWEKNGYDEKDVISEELKDDCLFVLKKDTFKTMLDPDDEPGQNLFMSFGTTFMHLERLPALGAQIDSIDGVIMNTLFSSILSIAYIVALVAIFIALLVRVIVIWIALVFSPILIAASIMGFGDGKAGEASEKIITYLIMPLKIAAAFAISFVMISGMIEFDTIGKNDGFLFGPALSNLGIAEYGFMWQMATIAIFWTAAKWASDGEYSKFITDKIFTGAEALGETAARAATIDRQIFAVGTDSSNKKFSMSNMLSAPLEAANLYKSKNSQQTRKLAELMAGVSGSAFSKDISTKNWGVLNQKQTAAELMKAEGPEEIDNHRSDLIKAWNRGSEDQTKLAKLLEDNPNEKASKVLHKYFKKNKTIWGYSGDMTRGDWYSGDSGTGVNPANGETKPVDTSDNLEVSDDEIKLGNNIAKKEGVKKYALGNTTDTQAILASNIMKEVHLHDSDIRLLSDMAGKTSEEFIKISAKDAKSMYDINLSAMKNRDKMEVDVSITDKVIFKEKDEKNKVQAVYLADRRSGVPDLSKFGGNDSDGKITNNIYNNMIEKSKTESGKKELEEAKISDAVLKGLKDSGGFTETTAEVPTESSDG